MHCGYNEKGYVDVGGNNDGRCGHPDRRHSNSLSVDMTWSCTVSDCPIIAGENKNRLANEYNPIKFGRVYSKFHVTRVIGFEVEFFLHPDGKPTMANYGLKEYPKVELVLSDLSLQGWIPYTVTKEVLRIHEGEFSYNEYHIMNNRRCYGD